MVLHERSEGSTVYFWKRTRSIKPLICFPDSVNWKRASRLKDIWRFLDGPKLHPSKFEESRFLSLTSGA